MERLSPGIRKLAVVYMAATFIILLSMMAIGLLMRLHEGGVIKLEAENFYVLITAHGTGMAGVAALGPTAILIYFLSRHIRISPLPAGINLVLLLIGLILILLATFGGRFAGSSTFIYPLPAMSMGAWGAGAATLYFVGLLFIGCGGVVLHTHLVQELMRRYGGLRASLGWGQPLGDAPRTVPPTVIAATVVTLVELAAMLAGTVILVLSLINLHAPGFVIDALLAKNLVFLFGHLFLLVTLYKAAIVLYELLPLASNRPWQYGRGFLIAWSAAPLLTLLVFPHHLLMDFAMPAGVLAGSQVISYLNVVMVLVITAWGSMRNVYRSGFRWDAASGFAFVSAFGWAAGIMPAAVDATIVVNLRTHNTLWVPGHFHFYLLVGAVAAMLAFAHHLADHHRPRPAVSLSERLAPAVFATGALGFVLMFLYQGKESVPRRFAEHAPAWQPYAGIGALFATMAVAVTLLSAWRFFRAVASSRA